MILNARGLRFATLDSNHELPFFWDPDSQNWLSCSETILSCGNPISAANGFLKIDNGATMTTTHGFQLPHDAQIRWMTTTYRGDLPPGASSVIALYNNGASVLSRPYGNIATLDVALSAGSLSLDLNASPSERPGYPNVQVGLRWRLP